MSLLQKINAVLANYDDLKATLSGPADSDKATELDLAAFEEIVALVKDANTTALAQCANVVSHSELGLPDEKTAKPFGVDANGNLIYKGDVVNHTSKPLVNGIVREPALPYKDEPAVVVDYEGHPFYVNRLSQLVKA